MATYEITLDHEQLSGVLANDCCGLIKTDTVIRVIR